jgi:hypothetical protein
MLNTLNTIAARKGMIVIPNRRSRSARTHLAQETGDRVAASVQAELMNLGFILERDAFDRLRGEPDFAIAYYEQVIPDLRLRMGNDRNYTPMYRNFPQQVMEMSNLQLFVNALLHYWSNGQWEPPQDEKVRELKYENVEFKRIRLATEEEFDGIFTRLCSLNTSLTEDDKGIIDWFLDHRKVTLPASIPFKETLCILASKGLNVPVKAPTDVLRIAVHMSGGDISLPGVPKITVKDPSAGGRRFRRQFDALRSAQAAARDSFKFKKFTRAERRRLLGFLEQTNPTVERISEGEVVGRVTEMQGRLGRWIRLGEILHPGEYESQFPKSAAAFKALRNQPPKIRTFNAQFDLMMRESPKEALALLAERPGEMARRLDWLLRTPREGLTSADVLGAFDRAARGVSGKVLFELYQHFDGRGREAPRSIIIKGKRAKSKALPPLPAMPAHLIESVKSMVMGAIQAGFASLPPLGAVWIDARLKKVPIPFAMRSVNTAIKTYVRGTRIPFRNDAKVVRAFVHWYDARGEEDLDLSAGLYTADLRTVTHLSFTNLKEPEYGCAHSGDIRHRVGACAEYVDISVQKCLDNNVRYAIVQVHNYNGRPMHSIKDTVFGMMEREHPEANKTFVPQTISNCMGLANEAATVIVCVIDLQEREYIWADIESDRGLPVLENTAQKSAEVMRSLIHGSKMSVYDLLAAHARVRGELVADRRDATTAFPWEDFVTDYAKVGEYMTFAPSSKPAREMVEV